MRRDMEVAELTKEQMDRLLRVLDKAATPIPANGSKDPDQEWPCDRVYTKREISLGTLLRRIGEYGPAD